MRCHYHRVLIFWAEIEATITWRALWGACLSSWLYGHIAVVLPFAMLQVSSGLNQGRDQHRWLQETYKRLKQCLPQTAWPQGRLLTVLQEQSIQLTLRISLRSSPLRPDMLIKDDYHGCQAVARVRWGFCEPITGHIRLTYHKSDKMTWRVCTCAYTQLTFGKWPIRLWYSTWALQNTISQHSPRNSFRHKKM